MHILMIEDDVELALLLSEHLQTREIQVTIASTPLDGLQKLQELEFDAVVLDLSLPQMDGLEICRIIRKESDIPIIISSARSDINDKTSGFSRGADDFLPKPYEPEELVLRLYAVLRRYHPQEINQPCFVVDTAKREIYKLGQLLNLTPTEFEIIAYMISKNGAVISRQELLLNIGTIRYESSLKSIDVVMGRIRSKIGDDTKNPKYILAVRGIGYKFVNQ